MEGNIRAQSDGYCRVFTQNCYGPGIVKREAGTGRKQDLVALRDYIAENGYDVVFLQEVVWPPLFWGMHGYHLVHRGGIFLPKGGLVTLLKQEPVGVEFLKYKDQGSLTTRQLMDRFLRKGILVARTGKYMAINTHLVCPYGNGNGRNLEANRNQLIQLMDLISDEMAAGNRIILSGDFNFNRDSDNYRAICSLLIDHTSPLGREAEFNAKEGQIDYIFSSFGMSSNHTVPKHQKFVSDHPGIGLELRLRKPTLHHSMNGHGIPSRCLDAR